MNVYNHTYLGHMLILWYIVRAIFIMDIDSYMFLLVIATCSGNGFSVLLLLSCSFHFLLYIIIIICINFILLCYRLPWLQAIHEVLRKLCSWMKKVIWTGSWDLMCEIWDIIAHVLNAIYIFILFMEICIFFTSNISSSNLKSS